MNKGVGLVLFLLLSLSVTSQQLPQYSQWFWNQMILNPAHSGIKPCVEAKSQIRAQYLGIEGAPNSGNFSLSLPIPTVRKRFLGTRHGVGLIFERDQIGPFSGNRLNLSYAIHMNFSQKNRLSVGIGAGLKQWSFNKDKSTTLTYDPLVQENATSLTPDANIGFWWNGDNYYLGFAFNEVLRNRWNNISDDSRFKFHYSLSGGYRWVVKDGITLLPSMMLRFPPKSKISADISLMIDFKNQFGFGLGMRNTDALMAYLNVKIKEQFQIAYSFDYVISPIGGNQFFTHEISVILNGCKVYSPTATGCPLF